MSIMRRILLSAIVAMPALLLAQGVDRPLSSDLPELQCDLYACKLVFRTANRIGTEPVARPNPYPVVAGPPPGQRLTWRGAGYPSCQTLGVGHNTAPAYPPNIGTSINNPYEYILASDVPVPIGSTHAFLLSSIEASISAGPSGTISSAALLQIRRSGGTWVNVDTGYVLSVRGMVPQYSQFNRTTFQGLVDLGTLVGSTGVPDAIDIRVVNFNAYSGDNAVKDLYYNQVCKGILDVTF